MNLLACDLGGTKTLFGVFTFDGEIRKLYQKKYYSQNWSNFNSLLTDFLSTIPNEIEYPSLGCIAIAGCVQGEQSSITNLGWKIDVKSLLDLTKLTDIELINDFCVLIYGLSFMKDYQYTEIYTPKVNNKLILNNKQNGRLAIIGAGTGLGVAKGVITIDGINALPSEGGHCEFAPRTNKEWDLSEWLKKELNLKRVSLERVVSGTGLGNIARWRLDKKDSDNHPIKKLIDDNNFSKAKPLPQVVSDFAEKGDPIMQEVIDIWLGAYGSAAGDLVLQELCTSGLWIAGGTLRKHIKGIRSMTFLNSMRRKGRFQSFIEKVPVKGLIDPEAGLFSAACKAHLNSKAKNP